MREITEIADGVHIGTSRHYATNSTILIDGAAAVLIDPSWDPDELDGIADWLEARRLTVVAGFATHAHHDHLLWHPRFGNAPRWASGPVAEIATTHRSELVEALGTHWPTELAELVALVDPLSAASLPWPGFPIELITHDAHAPGHTGLWLPRQATLLAGDMLSDLELPLAEQTGIQEYLVGLNALAPYASRAKAMVPGHGNPAWDGVVVERLRADQQYWQDLMNRGHSQDPRISLPDMAEAHAHHQALVAGRTAP